MVPGDSKREEGPQRGDSSRLITKQQFEERGKVWPFSVDSGRLSCEGAGAVVFQAGETTYAVNGIARGVGYPEVSPIWKDDPEVPGLKLYIGNVLDLGLSLCDGS